MVILSSVLRDEFFRRGAGTWYGYQGIAKVYSGRPGAMNVQNFSSCGVGIEDYARYMASNLENAGAFAATVGIKNSKPYLIRLESLPTTSA